MSHIAIDGAAESTSPSPPIRRIISDGSPTAAAIAVRMPTGSVAMYDDEDVVREQDAEVRVHQ